jgi:hypothetical protein
VFVHSSNHAITCTHRTQGFSGQLFPLFYDAQTWNPYKRADQVAIVYEGGPLNRSSQPSSMFIAFPALRKLAQEHFGCPSLPGAPADVPSFASHFKQRVFGVSCYLAFGVCTRQRGLGWAAVCC